MFCPLLVILQGESMKRPSTHPVEALSRAEKAINRKDVVEVYIVITNVWLGSHHLCRRLLQRNLAWMYRCRDSWA